MDDRRSDIIMELERGLAETIAFYNTLEPVELEVKVYSDEESWTVKQVLAHFITIEQSMHWLFNNILSGGSGTPDDFDLERFNRTQPIKFFSLSADDLIEQFTAVRKKTIAVVNDMNEDDLDRDGLHAFLGQGRLERFIRWAYEHARIHENDIREVLRIR